MQQTIREMTKHLMELGDEDWGRYAFRHEPLKENFQKHKRRPTRALRWNADEKRLIL